jgi:hypothetical protein
MRVISDSGRGVLAGAHALKLGSFILSARLGGLGSSGSSARTPVLNIIDDMIANATAMTNLFFLISHLRNHSVEYYLACPASWQGILLSVCHTPNQSVAIIDRPVQLDDMEESKWKNAAESLWEAVR